MSPQDEQSKRRQAERDFLDLMESIEQSGGGGGERGALVSRRLGDMQGRVEALEGEKQALEENVRRTKLLMQVGDREGGLCLPPADAQIPTDVFLSFN